VIARLFEALGVNAVSFHGLLRDDWTLATLLAVYWGENLLNTLFVGARILLHRIVTRKRGHWTVKNEGKVTVRLNGREIAHEEGGTTTLLASFVSTNLVFTLAHGIFVAAFLYGILEIGPSWERVQRGLVAIATMQTIGFGLDAATIRTRSFAWIRHRADAALGRIVVMHLGLIGGAFILAATERPATFFIVFVALKLLFEVGTMVPWADAPSAEAPAPLRALGRWMKKPGVEDVWKKEVDAVKRKQLEDEEPLPA